MSERVVIHVTDPPPRRDRHPCEIGAHAWAWRIDGAQECYRCGKERR